MELHRLRIFSVLVESSIYFLRDAKYISTIVLSLHRPAKFTLSRINVRRGVAVHETINKL
jgi:hypothetical protein